MAAEDDGGRSCCPPHFGESPSSFSRASEAHELKLWLKKQKFKASGSRVPFMRAEGYLWLVLETAKAKFYKTKQISATIPLIIDLKQLV